MVTLVSANQLQSLTRLHTLSGLRLEHTNFTRPKPLLLLAYLCIEGKKDKRFLAELFWPGASNHLNSLAKALSLLRQVGVVDNDDTHAWATVTSDANEFLTALEQHDLEKAVSLYQGSFLSGFYLPDWSVEVEEWLYTTREFLAARMREALLGLAEVSHDVGMATHYAERAYDVEATLEPDLIPRLYKWLANTPRRLKLEQEAQDFGISLEQPKTIKSNLPARGTSFIGRDLERLELAELLLQNDVRMVTVVGQGGVGKTRLALEVAKEVKDNFPDGVVYFPVENLITPEQMLAGLADALSVQLTQEDCTIQLPRIIGDKRVLLLMDNMEHQAENAYKSSLFLARCPNAKVLNTSRIRLNVEEEWVYALEGFSVPEKTTRLGEAHHHDAVALFVQRARKVNPGFTLDEDSLPFVLEICERVQGLPLGIELAASWVKVLSPREIAEQLEAADLSTSLSHVPERHRSLRHVFEGSWQLLSKEEQTVLSQLSVFQGGFSSEAAREVAGASLLTLARLVDKSLLRVVNHRYEQHLLLRSFAEEKLLDALQAKERHAVFFLELARKAEPHLNGSQQKQWLEKLNSELGNLRTAFSHAKATNNIEVCLELSGGLHRLWMSGNLASEGRTWLQEALALSPNPPAALQAKALYVLGALAWQQGDFAEARRSLKESVTLHNSYDDVAGKAKALGTLANVATEEGNYNLARRYYEESLVLGRSVNHLPSVASATHNLGILGSQQGYFAEAKIRYEESLQLFRQLGNEQSVANNLNSLARVSWELGDVVLAETFATQALPLHEALQSYLGQSISHVILARVSTAKGRRDRAFSHYRESTRLQAQSGDKPGLISSLEDLAALLKDDDPERTACLYSVTETFRKSVGFARTPKYEEKAKLELSEVKEQLGETTFAKHWAKGLTMTLEQAVALGLEPQKAQTA